tara:strand:- start:328 stop:486 length:159 start_codon:yes stop_codon:yes gene_type:complete
MCKRLFAAKFSLEYFNFSRVFQNVSGENFFKKKLKLLAALYRCAINGWLFKK